MGTHLQKSFYLFYPKIYIIFLFFKKNVEVRSKFLSRLSGKILLDIEQNGKAYYVNPNDLKGYFPNRPADAFKVMRELGLGIANIDIRKIEKLMCVY